MTEFLSGGSMVAALTIAYLFHRFWRRSGDRFFALFALAFVVFGINRLVLNLLGDNENALFVYASRAAAFLLIIVAIVDKNRADRAPR